MEEPATTKPVTPPAPPIIRIKRKGSQGKNHSDAWKVAYADFVTAMMALFIVLWLMSSSSDVQKSVAGYFRDPKGFGAQTGSSMKGNGEGLSITKSSMSLLQGEIERALKSSPQFEDIKDYVQMTITGDGLRVELVDTEKGLFFESGQAVPTQKGKALIEKLAPILGAMPRSILVEGHTDSKPFGNADYSNWDLSIDRANAARTIMEKSGLRANQVVQVRGFADQQPRPAKTREDSSNRRISIVVQFAETPEADDPPASKEGEAGQHSQ